MASRHPVGAALPTPAFPPAVSASVLAALALIATCSAQALAPALMGSATGIAGLIDATHFIAACTSQLVAAGGIAFCVRLLAHLLPWPSLGVAFRMVIAPATIGVVLLTVTSATRPLDPELGRVVAVSAIVAGLVSAPILWAAPRTRMAGIVLLLAALGAVCDFVAYEIGWRTGFSSAVRSGAIFAALGVVLDAAAALAAFTWAAGDRRRIGVGLVVLVSVVVLLAIVAQGGTRHTAPGVLVALHRGLEALADRPLLALPAALRQALTLLPLPLAAAILLLPGRKPELRAALTLCLLGRTASGAPAAALLTIGAALAAIAALIHIETMPRTRAAQS